MTTKAALILLALLMCDCRQRENGDFRSPNRENVSHQATLDPASPPGVYVAFVTAFLDGDRATAEKLCVPGYDLTVLFSEALLPRAQREFILKGMQSAPYRVVKNGETVVYPNGEKVTVDERLSKAGLVLIVAPGDPMPHVLRNLDGIWRVDPEDLINMRKRGQKKPQGK